MNEKIIKIEVSHDELVDACKESLKLIKKWVKTGDNSPGNAGYILKQALAKAEEVK